MKHTETLKQWDHPGWKLHYAIWTTHYFNIQARKFKVQFYLDQETLGKYLSIYTALPVDCEMSKVTDNFTRKVCFKTLFPILCQDYFTNWHERNVTTFKLRQFKICTKSTMSKVQPDSFFSWLHPRKLELDIIFWDYLMGLSILEIFCGAACPKTPQEASTQILKKRFFLEPCQEYAKWLECFIHQISCLIFTGKVQLSSFSYSVIIYTSLFLPLKTSLN